MGLHSLLLQQLFGHIVTTQNDAFEWEYAPEDKGYESGSESIKIPTPLHRTLYLYHVSASENLSFGPATPLTHWAYSPHWHSSLSSICHCLMFSNDDSSSTDSNPLHGRIEQSSPVEQQMASCLKDDSFQDVSSEEKEEEEQFPTAPLDDAVWMDEPVPERHLCIHEQSQPHDLCPYPCPYSLDQLYLAPEYAPTPQYMDLSDIFNFPHVMTTTRNEDIPGLDDVFGLWIWTVVWIHLYTSQTLNTWTHTNCMKQDKYIYEHWEAVWLWIHVKFKHIFATWIVKNVELQIYDEQYWHVLWNIYISGTLNEFDRQWTLWTCIVDH